MSDQARKLFKSFITAVLVALAPGTLSTPSFAGPAHRPGSRQPGVASIPQIGLSAGISALNPSRVATRLEQSAAIAADVVAQDFPPAASPLAVDDHGAEPINSELAYGAHQVLLKMAAFFGEVHSLRPAGPELTRLRIAQAWDASGVVTDLEQTLVAPNMPAGAAISEEIVRAWRAVKAAGKSVDVISERLGALTTMASVPADVRAGAFVAVNGGERIYRYDEAGEPILVHEAPKISEALQRRLAAAWQSAEEKLSEASSVGVLDHQFTSYRYTMRLPYESTPDQVREAAAVLQQEVSKRAPNLVVETRMGKNTTEPPYLFVSAVTKGYAAGYIAAQRGLKPQSLVLLGDSTYLPQQSWAAFAFRRLGERVSGRSLPQRGSDEDVEMARALPGARVFSVGRTGDPRVPNLTVLSHEGPVAARRVLFSVASVPIAESAAAARGLGQEFVRRVRILGHMTSHYAYSVRKYFIKVTVGDWHDFELSWQMATAKRPSAVSNPRGLFIYTRMLGMLGGQTIIGTFNGSTDYMRRDALRLFDRYFDLKKVSYKARKAFIRFLERAVSYNCRRNASNLRKQMRKAIIQASQLPPTHLEAHFNEQVKPGLQKRTAVFQQASQDLVREAFRRAMVATVEEENPASPDRVVGIVLFGGFGNGAASATSDFDLQVLTHNGSSVRVRAFLSRLDNRWSLDPESKSHPINGAQKGFMPEREVLFAIHHDPFRVMSPDEKLERMLSPPEGHFDDRTRPDNPTLLQKLEWSFFFGLLSAMIRIDNVRQSFRRLLSWALRS